MPLIQGLGNMTQMTTRPVALAETDPRTLLSAAWIFAMFNYLYADVIGLMDPSLLRQFLDGRVDGLAITRPFLFGAALLMEVPIAMTLLARTLPRRPNRMANMVAAGFKTVVVGATLTLGRPSGYYVFFSVIEMATTVAIGVVAYRWKDEAAAPS